MANEETKHRVKLPLYDLRPRLEQCWVAPNSTIGKLRSVILSSTRLYLNRFLAFFEQWVKSWSANGPPSGTIALCAETSTELSKY